MTLTVGICDDYPEQIELIRRYLRPLAKEFPMTIISSADPEEFLEQLKASKPHIVFLDIDMGASNGIQLGEQIKVLYEDAVIIYVTGHEQYALEAFRVRAFHYLLKPLTEEKFIQVFREAVQSLAKGAKQKPVKKLFKLQRKGEILYLDYEDILFFEKIGRRMSVCTKHGTFDFYNNIAQLLGEIDSNTFMQCHQGFIINTSKILAYHEKNLYLGSDLRVPVSRSFAAEIQDMLAKKLFTKEDEA